MGIHIFGCAHGEERMALHDVVRGVFATIAKDVKFHVCESKPMSFCLLHCSFWVV